jgi:hypothetical protein
MIHSLPSTLLTAIVRRLPQDNLFAVALVCRELHDATAEAAVLLGCENGKRLARGGVRLKEPEPRETFKAFLARTLTQRDSSHTFRDAEHTRPRVLPKGSAAREQGEQPGARPAAAPPFRCTTRVTYLLRCNSLSLLQWGVACGVPLTPKLFKAAASVSNLEILRYLRAIGCAWDERTCASAASVGRLEVLQWAREEGCPWDASTCERALFMGRVESFEWALANGCPYSADCWRYALARGSIIEIQSLRARGCPWVDGTCIDLVRGGHTRALEWALANGCPRSGDYTCVCAAEGGHLGTLQWLRANGFVWDASTCTAAASKGHLTVLRWVRAHGCPWDGETYASAARWAEKTGDRSVLSLCVDNGCPEPPDDGPALLPDAPNVLFQILFGNG